MNPLSYFICIYLYNLSSLIKLFVNFICRVKNDSTGKIMEFLVIKFPWAWLAQSVERWTFNPTVAGSSPASGLIFFSLFSSDFIQKCVVEGTLDQVTIEMAQVSNAQFRILSYEQNLIATLSLMQCHLDQSFDHLVLP